MPLSLSARVERWPIAGRFTIARGAKTEAVVIVAELSDGSAIGRGECVPYARYGETVEGVAAAIRAMRAAVAGGLDRAALQSAMPAGAARNALDCAFWDFEAKASGKPAHALAHLPPPRALTTAYTISLDTADAMADAARKVAARSLLKVKLGSTDDAARIAAVRGAAPRAELIVDANEGWRAGNLAENIAACAAAGVTLIEQPLPADDDDALAELPHPIPVCADESCRTAADLDRLAGKYQAVNIKLDKTGGLTAALHLAKAARERGFSIMVGCMIGTSLAMAPALLVAQQADIVDLDGPLLLAADRNQGLRYDGGVVHPPDPKLWG